MCERFKNFAFLRPSGLTHDRQTQTPLAADFAGRQVLFAMLLLQQP